MEELNPQRHFVAGARIALASPRVMSPGGLLTSTPQSRPPSATHLAVTEEGVSPTRESLLCAKLLAELPAAVDKHCPATRDLRGRDSSCTSTYARYHLGFSLSYCIR